MKLIFVRHGEPLKHDYGIAEMGKKELGLLGEYFKERFSINQIISATSQRASESAAILGEILDKDITYYDWLSEFKHRLPDNLPGCEYPWEFPPELWINDEEMLDPKKVLYSEKLKSTVIPNKAKEVWTELDRMIEKHGYKRVGNLYEVQQPNTEEVVIVTHFATMAVMLAHLWNVSLIVTLNMLFMAPSSYTVLASEEITKGRVIFRCLELGSTKHLYNNEELISEYGRQPEIRL